MFLIIILIKKNVFIGSTVKNGFQIRIVQQKIHSIKKALFYMTLKENITNNSEWKQLIYMIFYIYKLFSLGIIISMFLRVICKHIPTCILLQSVNHDFLSFTILNPYCNPNIKMSIPKCCKTNCKVRFVYSYIF